MDKNGAAFLKRLLATFKAEAEEHLRALSAGLIELEQASDAAQRQQVVETVFRETHSLKGAARAVGKVEIETLCHGGESVFAALKEGDIALSPALLDLLHAAVDVLGRLLLAVDGEPAGADLAAVADLRRRLDAAAAGAPVAAPGPRARAGTTASAAPEPSAPAVARAPPPAATTPPAAAGVPSAPAAEGHAPAEEQPAPAEVRRPLVEAANTVRIPASRLDAVLFQAEAMLGAKLAASQRVSELREARTSFGRQQRERAKVMAEVRLLRRGLERDIRAGAKPAAGAATPRLRRLVDYLAAEESFLKAFGARLDALAKVAEQGARSLGGQVDGLLDDVKRVLMLPIASAIEGLPKLVRDLSREQGKEVDFRASGDEVEIDRRILEEMRDPLIHLLRNSLDHGIEPPAVRLAAGKPQRGSLTLSAAQIEGSRIEIRVADDGAGIDLARLRTAAHKLGLATAQADEAALLPLVFQSGVSTRPLVTDISGRGLGLAIVREKVERLGGTVAVESRAGVGTAFHLVLPLTLATFHGVRVRAAGEEFIFPSMVLERVVRVRRDEIATIENREAIRIAGQAVALVRLGDVLELAAAAGEPPSVAPAVVAGAGERRVAFLVDEVIGEQEVLVKGLGRQLRRVRNIAGATVLGTGQVVPILYVPDLLKSARHAGAGPARPAPPAAVPEAKSILVVEDSITSRMLLKGILESAGYRVTTAVDGIDAYTRLRTEAIDLLVSDVDMPRLNGLDLTARVRADRSLAELPVVLVTALDSREARERGAEVGANAYLVKSSFDQSNLLAVVRRLL